MLTTANGEYDRLFRLWRQHGMTLSDRHRHNSQQVTFEAYEMMGYNYRMTDLQAAVGRVQLARLPEIVRQRREVALRYHHGLASHPGLRPPLEPVWARSNWQSFCVGLPKACDQAKVMQALLDAGITTRRGIMCAHREPAYKNDHWRKGSELTRSEEAQDHSILLPLYPGMTAHEQDFVLDHLVRMAGTQKPLMRVS